MENVDNHAKKELAVIQKAIDTVPGIARSAVMEDKAKTIIFGCTFYSGWKTERKIIEKELKVPLLDPNVTALRVAEMLIQR